MVAPIIGAVARAAASKAAKAVSAKGAKAVSRARKAGDDIYNARRRFTRAAERYEKKARSATGTLEGKYKALAREELKNALATYEKPPGAKKFLELAEKLDVDLSFSKPTTDKRSRLINASMESLESTLDDVDFRRDREANAILNSNVGHRIYGGLANVWSGKSGDINELIMRHFGVDSMADVIERIEAEIDIYADPEKTEKYDEIKAAIELAFA